MNVRFAPDEVRIRVTRDELTELLQRHSLRMTVPLPGQHAFQASVATERLADWRLDSDPTGIWVSLPLADIHTLSESGPTAEGLVHQFALPSGGNLELRFEVDVRS